MAKVSELPIGSDVTLIKGIDDRVRDLEARRNRFNMAAGGSTYTFTGTANHKFLSGWPEIDVNVAASGFVWLLAGCTGSVATTGNPGTLTVVIDGGTSYLYSPATNSYGPMQVTASPSTGMQNNWFGGSNGGFTFTGVTGLTPGFHTFQLWVWDDTGITAGATASEPWMMVWPL